MWAARPPVTRGPRPSVSDWISENLALPFKTKVLVRVVSVVAFELDGDDPILAICEAVGFGVNVDVNVMAQSSGQRAFERLACRLGYTWRRALNTPRYCLHTFVAHPVLIARSTLSRQTFTNC